MKLENRLLSLMSIVVILSTLVAVTILSQRPQKSFKVLTNDYPSKFYDLSYTRGKEMTFSLAVLANERFRRLELSFAILSLIPLDLSNMIDPELDPQDALELLNNTVGFREIRELSSDLGLDPEVIAGPRQILGETMDAVVYDFTPALKPFLTTSDITSMVTIFSALRDENGVGYYYEGCPSFFFEPSSNLVLLSVAQNEDETSYIPGLQGSSLPGYLPMSAAPGAGTVSFCDTKKYDAFSILFSVEAQRQNLPDGFGRVSSGQLPIGMMQLVRLYLDGQKEAEFLNPIAIAKGD